MFYQAISWPLVSNKSTFQFDELMKTTLIKVIGGNFVSQVLGMISVPLMLTSYSANEVGGYGFFVSASAVASIFISMRAENIMFSVSNRKAKALFNFCVAWLLSITILIIVIAHISTIATPPLFFATVTSSIAMALFNLGYGLNVRLARTGRYVFTRILRNLCELIAVVISAVFTLKISTLAWLVALSYIIATVFSAHDLLSICGLKIASGLRILKNNLDFLKYDFASSLFNAAALNTPVLYFYLSGESEISGIFFAVTRILGVPTLMLAQSIGTTLKQHAADERASSGHCYTSFQFVVEKIIFRLMPLYIFVWIALSIGAFLWFDGPDNANTFWIILFLSALFLIRYIFNCISPIIYVIRMQVEHLIFQISLLIFGWLGLLISQSTLTSVGLYAFFSSIVYICFFLWLMRKFYLPQQLIEGHRQK